MATSCLIAQYKTYGAWSCARVLMICKLDENDIHQWKWPICMKSCSHALVHLSTHNANYTQWDNMQHHKKCIPCVVSFPDPTTHARKRSGDITGIFLVLRTITWPHVLQYKPMQIIIWLLSLQNQESVPMSPDPSSLGDGVWGRDYTMCSYISCKFSTRIETWELPLISWLSNTTYP